MSEDAAMNNTENGKGNEDDRKIFAGGLPQVRCFNFIKKYEIHPPENVIFLEMFHHLTFHGRH